MLRLAGVIQWPASGNAPLLMALIDSGYAYGQFLLSALGPKILKSGSFSSSETKVRKGIRNRK
jgi:hypothetical protein